MALTDKLMAQKIVHFITLRKHKNTLPVKPILIGKSSVDCSINCMWNGPGVQVVARVPSAGPVPPPTSVVIPIHDIKLSSFLVK